MLSAGELVAGASKVSLVWPVLLHFVIGVGYLYAAPIALSLVSRAAPPAVNAMMVGAYYLGIFLGGIVSGWLGRFYEPLQPMLFWLVHAGIGGLGALAIVVLRPVLVRELKLDART
jgi:POT family proton-dependent oligopeptide transporter